MALAAALLLPFVATSQTHALTVADGTATHDRLPVYGLYVDELQRNQIVYSASMIESASDAVNMVGGTINSLTFYLGSTATQPFGCTFTVKVMEVPGNGTISGFANTSSAQATTVYTGTLDASQSTMTVTFSTPYVYGGGNLLVEFANSTTSQWYSSSFYGVNTSHTASWTATGGSTGEGVSFVPKTTFSFTGGGNVTCHAVQNLAVAAVTDSSATLRWSDPNNTVASYTVYNALDTSAIATAISDTSYTVTGLNPNTAYSFIVEANCSSSDASLWRLVETRTECVAFDFPYNTGFEEMASNENPSCWDILSGGPYVHENTNLAYRGDQFLHFEGSTHTIAVMPEMTDSLVGKQVRFMTRPEDGNYTNCGNLQVGYITNLADLNSFVPLATYPVTLWGSEFAHEYYEQIVEFNNVPAGARVAFCHNPLYDNYFWYVDNVVLEVQPSCHRPSNFQAVAVTDTSVTLSWSPNDDPNATYTIYDYYDTTVYASGISDTSCTITGLAANTLYSLSLAANCSASEESLWTSLDVRTECGVVAVPYDENFERESTGSHPMCWEHLTHVSSYANVCNVTAYGTYEGNAALRFEYSLATGNVVALPAFNTPTSQLRLRFMQRAESTDANCGNLQVGYLTNAADAATFVPLATLDRVADYSRTIVSFAAAPDSARIAFRHLATGNNYYWYVDDLHVETIPACGDIDNVDLVTVTESSVSVSWSGTGAAGYLVEARQGSVVVASATTSSDTVATLSGLTLGQDYTVYVRSLCGNDSSLWSNPLSVHIGYCTPSPYLIDGQGIVNVSYGYDEVVNSNNRPTSAPYYGNYTNLVGDLPLSMPVDVAVTYSTNCTYGTIIWIDLNKDMAFDDSEIVYTGMSDATAPTTLHASFVLDADQDTGRYIMRIAGADYAFDDFVGSGSGFHDPCGAPYYAMYVDYSVHIVPAPACIPVSDVAVSNLTGTSATISWNHIGVASYSIFNGSTALATGIDSTHYTLTGLTPATYYDLTVVANCVAGDDAMAIHIAFSTPCSGALSLPFAEGFGASSPTRGCWDISSNNAENSWNTAQGLAFLVNRDAEVLRFSSYETASNGDYNQYAYSPSLDVSGADALRIFVRYWTQTTTDNLYFGYVTPNGTVWDETPYFSATAGEVNTYELYIPAVASQVVIRYFGNYRYYAFIDSVSVTAAVVNNVTLTSSDASRGSVAPEGTTLVPQGGSFTATATAAEGFHFSGWYEGTTLMSAANPYTFVPSADITLTAAFEPDVVYYTVTVSCDTLKGTVTGDGTFEEGSTVTLTANPKEGFGFNGWLDGTDIIDANPYTFTLTADRSLTVLFHTVGIDDVEGSSLALRPNPATTTVTLEGLSTGSRVTLLGLNGRECGQWTADGASLTIDVSTLPRGAYFLRIVSAGSAAVRKLVVR